LADGPHLLTFNYVVF